MSVSRPIIVISCFESRALAEDWTTTMHVHSRFSERNTNEMTLAQDSFRR